MSSSRFSQGGDSRYPPRDRSPPRFERRGSTQYDSGTPSRPSDSSYRPNDPYSGAPRDAPRAPKAQDGPTRGGYSSRSRGALGSRSDRDAWESPYPRRREKDDWSGPGGDSETRGQRRPSPVNLSRGRSRSPPTRDYRDKDVNTPRARDPPLSASSVGSDGPGGYFARGGSYRGRGRGDYDGRSRGRGIIPEERDTYKARSRSRERPWRERERDYRDERPRDRDRDFDDGERFRREPPIRPESRNSGGSQTNPSTPLTANPTVSGDRWRDAPKQTTPSAETSRRQSLASYESRPEFRASLSNRPDNATVAPQAQSPSSPPQPVHSVPFASSGRPTPGSRPPPPPSSQQLPQDESATSRQRSQDPILNAPKAPKAELQIPKGPRAGAPYPIRPVTGPATPSHRHDPHQDIQNLQSPSLQRFGQSRPGGGPAFAPPSQPRNFGQWTSPTFSSRPTAPDGPLPPPSLQDPGAGTVGSHPGIPGKHIPTGPRAQQPSIRASMHRPTEPAAMAAARRISNQPKGPSIMKPLIPTKRDSIGDERSHGDRRGSIGQTDKEHRRASATMLGSRDHGSSLGLVYAEDGGKMDVETDTAAADGDSTGQADESDEDDLSEEDYEEAERAYRKDIENLEAKRPPSPGHHPELVLLLEELNALEAAAQDLRNGVIPPPIEDDENVQKRPPLGLPSPSSDDVDQTKQEDNAIAMLDEASISEELPVDGLPFLRSRPLTPVSDIDCFDVDDPRDVRTAQFVLQAIQLERTQEEAELGNVRAKFADEFKRFRLMQDDLDDRKRREDNLKKAVSPQPQATDEQPKEAPAATGRRRDRSTFSTSAEEQTAIQASRETFEKEQKEREEREILEAAQREDLPDLTREAEIPNMYTMSDRRADMFEDTNQLVPTQFVLQAFEFITPPDDFTEEEQEKFIEAYIATPKKWGHIARELPGRDYQDCIRHYYLTKKDMQYKLIADRRKTKRGRGRKVAAGKPKASALLSDIHRGEGPTQDELTDAGRPKRAAAPVSFGEPKKSLMETASGKTTPGRRAGNAKASDGPDSSSDKPAGRGSRGGRAGGARKDGRGRGSKATASATASGNTSNAEGPPIKPNPSTTSAPLLAPGPTPQKNSNESPRRSKSTEWRIEEGGSRPLESADSRVEGIADAAAVAHAGQSDNWRDSLPSMVPPSDVRNAAPPSRPPTSDDPNASGDRAVPITMSRSVGQGRGPGQVSSYWSVSEVELFNQLIRHFGTDWTSIASLLTTKSQTMVKNYYQRQIDKGKNMELEQIATEVDKRNRERGGPPPNPQLPVGLPPPHQPPRRRPEPAQQLAPQPTVQRPLAPSSEIAEAEAAVERTSTQASPYGPRAHLVPLRQAGAPLPPTAVAEAAAHARPSTQEQPPTRATSYYPLDQRERRLEAEARPAQSLEQERYPTMLSAQHPPVHDQHGIPPQRDTVDPYASRQPLAQQPSMQPTMAAGRTPQMSLAELDRGTRPAPYPTKQEAYPVKPEHYPPKNEHTPPDLRRETSYGNERYRQTAQAAQLSPHPPPPRPYPDTSRPSSVIQPTSAAVPPPEARPNPPAEKKRSNIMMMLNDDPPEPPKSQQETRPAPAVPHHASPASSTPMYQPPAQPGPPYSRRDAVEAARHHEPPRHPYGEATYGSQPAMPHQQPPTQLSHQQAIQPPSERRDPPSWTAGIGRSFAFEQPRQYVAPAEQPRSYQSAGAEQRAYSAHVSEQRAYPASAAEQTRQYQSPVEPPRSYQAPTEPARHGYHAPAAASPAVQHSYLSRTAPRIESPPPSHRGHSRASSYTNQHPGQTLAPHPYANVAPPTSSQPAQPAQQQQQQQQVPSSYGHHVPPHIPPPPYSQQASMPPQPVQPVQAVQPPPRPGSTFMDPLRRDEELRRYASPGIRGQYGGYAPPERPYERRDDRYERRDGYDGRYDRR